MARRARASVSPPWLSLGSPSQPREPPNVSPCTVRRRSQRPLASMARVEGGRPAASRSCRDINHAKRVAVASSVDWFGATGRHSDVAAGSQDLWQVIGPLKEAARPLLLTGRSEPVWLGAISLQEPTLFGMPPPAPSGMPHERHTHSSNIPEHPFRVASDSAQLFPIDATAVAWPLDRRDRARIAVDFGLRGWIRNLAWRLPCGVGGT
jgi:hypothetical protein